MPCRAKSESPNDKVSKKTLLSNIICKKGHFTGLYIFSFMLQIVILCNNKT